MRILFIDDEPELLKQAKIFLEKEDERLDVFTASTAEEGLELLDSYNFDAIVSDYKMSGMDGFEFLEKIREERGSEIPFIVFTGKGSEEVAMEALNLGADRYVMKGGDVGLQFEDLADAVFDEVYSRSESSITSQGDSEGSEGENVATD